MAADGATPKVPVASGQKRRLLVAVGGASCSGKSTLTEWLALILKCHVIHQDVFFNTDADVPLVNGVKNWDCPLALDMQRFHETLLSPPSTSLLHTNRTRINSSDISTARLDALKNMARSIPSDLDVYLVDGFLLYDDPTIIATFDLRLFLTSGFETLKGRREAREGYVTKEGYWKDPPNYFAEYVWPAYTAYNSAILAAVDRHSLTEQAATGAEFAVHIARASLSDEVARSKGHNYIRGGAGTSELNGVHDEEGKVSVFTVDSQKLGIEEMVARSLEYIVAKAGTMWKQ